VQHLKGSQAGLGGFQDHKGCTAQTVVNGTSGSFFRDKLSAVANTQRIVIKTKHGEDITREKFDWFEDY
jgi:hypothetical protein